MCDNRYHVFVEYIFGFRIYGSNFKLLLKFIRSDKSGVAYTLNSVYADAYTANTQHTHGGATYVINYRLLIYRLYQ